MSYTKTTRYATTDIVDDVEICMDEIADNDSEFDSNEQDDTERATIIKSKIPEALRFVLAHADFSLLDPDTILTAEDATYKNASDTSKVKYAQVELPDDFLRLVYATDSTWAMAQNEEDIVEWNDKEYPMLSDLYAGGTAERPRIALTWGMSTSTSSTTSTDATASSTTTPVKILELYPAKEKEEIAVGILTEPEEQKESESVKAGWNIPTRCYRALIYYIAGLTYVTYADQTRSSMMFEQANDIIGFTAKAAIQQQQNEQQ